MGEVPKWMLTYSDMMTLLLCVFVLLLSFANTDVVKYRSATGSVEEAFGVQKEVVAYGKDGGMELPIDLKGTSTAEEIEKSRLVNLLKSAAEAESLSKNAMISIVNNGAKVDIMEDVGNAMFKPGGAELLEESKTTLRKLLPLMQDSPYKITIEGHTDDSPVNSDRYPSNWELSSARAGCVVRFFIQEGNLDPKRFKAVGYADSFPQFENDSPENKAKNRRVSIVFELF